MGTEPLAVDLGAIRARHHPWTHRERATPVCAGYHADYPCDVAVVLAAYDAQEARFMEVEAERDAWKNAHDGGECKFKQIYHACRLWGLEHKARADAQAARLAAVEAERDDALIVVRNAQDYLRGKYTLEPLRTLRDAVRDWEAQQADGEPAVAADSYPEVWAAIRRARIAQLCYWLRVALAARAPHQRASAATSANRPRMTSTSATRRARSRTRI